MTVGAVTYHFPAEHIDQFIEPGEGLPYAKLRPPGANFQLIYLARDKYSRNFAGGNAPLISTVTDHSAPEPFEHFNTASGVTVCRNDHPHYGCGLRIEDEGVAWSVVFDRDQVPNSDAIRAAAENILKTYRS